MTVNEIIKALQKLKRKDKDIGDFDVAILCNALHPVEVTGVSISSEYDDIVNLEGDY